MLPFAERSVYYPTLPVLELRDWDSVGTLRESEVIDTADFLPAIRSNVGNTTPAPLFLDRGELSELPGGAHADPRFYLSVFWTFRGQSNQQDVFRTCAFTLTVRGGEELVGGAPDGVLHRFVGWGDVGDIEYPGSPVPAPATVPPQFHGCIRIDSRYLQLQWSNVNQDTVGGGLAASTPTEFHLGAYLRVI